MDDLNDTLCAVISGITNQVVDNVCQLADGAILPHILEKIDPQTFKADDNSLTSWKTVQDRLDAFLESKGIKDRGLELPIQELEEGDEDSIVSTILQIFAVYVTFNKSSWDQVMKNLDFVTFTHITKLLDSMVTALRELVELSQKMTKYDPHDLSLAVLLSKLETKEDELEKKDADIKKLQEGLAKETALKSDLAKKLKDTERELLEMQELKERAFEDLIRKEAGGNDEVAAEKQLKMIRENEREIIDLKQKLSSAQTSNIDRDLEISKLNSLIATLTASHNQNEDLKRQLDHYEKSSKDIRVQNEYLNSRINSMSNVDGLIKNLNTKLKEEKERSLKLQAQLEETQPLIENLQKRIDFLETQKKLYTGSAGGGATEFSDLHSLELFRTLEFENQQYRKQIEELQAINRKNQHRIFTDSIMEKENEALRQQIEVFLASGDLSVLRQGKSTTGEVATGLEFSDSVFKQIDSAQGLASIDQLPGFTFTSDQKEKPRASGLPLGEYADILYTTLMEFYKNELADQKKFVMPRAERERNILKQFMLTDMLQGE